MKCFLSCIERRYKESYNCIPNPYLDQNFIYINFKNYSEICQKKIEKELKTNFNNICKKYCQNNYKQIRYKIELKDFENTIYKSNNTELTIEQNSLREIQYIAKSNLELSVFLSDIGGLFGLWCGLSFIDMSAIIKIINMKLRSILYVILKVALIKKLGKNLIKILNELIKLIAIIENLSWVLLLKIMLIPMLFVQNYFIISEYFKYSTQISVEFPKYLIDGSTNKISIDEFPSITVCNEHMFERILFDETYGKYYNKFYESSSYLEQLCNDNKNDPSFIKKNCRLRFLKTKNIMVKNILIYFFVNNLYDEELFYITSDKLTRFKYKPGLINFIFNYFDLSNISEYNHHLENSFKEKNLFDEFSYYHDHYSCDTYFNPSKYCNQTKPTLKLLSKMGKCHQYLSGYNIDENFINLFKLSEFRIDDKRKTPIFYLDRKFYLHKNDFLPDYEQNEMNFIDMSRDEHYSFVAMISKYEFVKQPPPYDTQCHEYSGNNRIECINDCYLREYQNRFHCLPQRESLYTLRLNESFDNISNICRNRSQEFTNNVLDINRILRFQCEYQCPISCLSTIYQGDIFSTQLLFRISTPIFDQSEIKRKDFIFTLKDTFYTKFIYNPKMTLFDLIIKVANVFSLYNGFNFVMISKLIHYLFSDKLIRIRKKFINTKAIKIFKVCR